MFSRLPQYGVSVRYHCRFGFISMRVLTHAIDLDFQTLAAMQACMFPEIGDEQSVPLRLGIIAESAGNHDDAPLRG